MVCGNDFGRQAEDPQPQQQCDKWHLSSKEAVAERLRMFPSFQENKREGRKERVLSIFLKKILV